VIWMRPSTMLSASMVSSVVMGFSPFGPKPPHPPRASARGTLPTRGEGI
jgi:hypothetical protein